MSENKCEYCDRMPAGQMFCEACGRRLAKAPVSPPSPSPIPEDIGHRSASKNKAVIGVLVAVIAVMAVIMFGMKGRNDGAGREEAAPVVAAVVPQEPPPAPMLELPPPPPAVPAPPQSVSINDTKWVDILGKELPEYSWLISIKEEVDGRLNIEAMTYSYSEVADYMLSIEKIKDINDVSLTEFMGVKNDEGRIAYRFTITCKVKR